MENDGLNTESLSRVFETVLRQQGELLVPSGARFVFDLAAESFDIFFDAGEGFG
jgi:hypothetical protein